ncbi:MAG: phosphonate ABC transporter ATP-binding protein [Opitutales bacterium]
MIKFDKLCKHYPDGTVAMQEVSLEIPQGQFCVLLGPSGAGKSTLLRTLNGLVQPTSGEIIFDERLIKSDADLRFMQQRVAMVHQSFNLVPRLSVMTNVLSGLLSGIPLWKSLLGLFPHEKKVAVCKLIEAVGLRQEHVYRRAASLSGGQQQRVGIARAFIGDPEVVLADEPVASLDPGTSREILHLLRKASQERNATVLCSLHQVDLAKEFADRIIAMKAGKMVFDGLPEELTPRVLADLYEDQSWMESAPKASKPAKASEVEQVLGMPQSVPM